MEEPGPPALFEHCSVVFEDMKKAAKPEQLEGIHAFVYEGFLTRLFAQRQLATPYYTRVMQALKIMGCVRQLSRGGGTAPSRWELITEPTLELFDILEQKRLKIQTKLGQVADMTNQNSKKIGTLEALVEALNDRLEALETRSA
jgi:hypothetical protein